MKNLKGSLKTGIVYDARYLNHRTENHPESPQRLVAIIEYLEEKGILKNVKRIKPYPAPEDIIQYIHTKEYVESVKRLCNSGGGMLDIDTYVSPETYNVALLAVGGILSMVDAIMANSAANGFCLVRPPGHHAMQDRGMGFCIFNNIAIGARYIQKNYKLKRVVIVDWDVHHGNGTQASFYNDPSVLYCSIHQYPHYPGTGSIDEVGINEGKGFTINAPVPSGSNIKQYCEIFEKRFMLEIKDFNPDFILLSSGFDAHTDDPLSGINLKSVDYGLLTQMVVSVAEKVCSGRLASVLEGGYNLNALKTSTYEHIKGLMCK